jgi:hypothetical protein
MQSKFQPRDIWPRKLVQDGWWLALPINPPPGDKPMPDLALSAASPRFTHGGIGSTTSQ